MGLFKRGKPNPHPVVFYDERTVLAQRRETPLNGGRGTVDDVTERFAAQCEGHFNPVRAAVRDFVPVHHRPAQEENEDAVVDVEERFRGKPHAVRKVCQFKLNAENLHEFRVFLRETHDETLRHRKDDGGDECKVAPQTGAMCEEIQIPACETPGNGNRHRKPALGKGGTHAARRDAGLHEDELIHAVARTQNGIPRVQLLFCAPAFDQRTNLRMQFGVNPGNNGQIGADGAVPSALPSLFNPESYILVTRFPEAGVTSAAGPA